MPSTVKFILLVPLRYNDGRKIPKRVFDVIFDDIFTLGNGITFAHSTKGAYRMADGSKKVDECTCIWIGVKKADIPALKRLVAEIGALLGQESMYLERSGGRVEFIPPRRKENGHESNP